MVNPSEPHYISVPVTCPHCKQKHVVHVTPRTGIAEMGSQAVKCVKCKTDFDVMLPDQIVGDPLAE